MFINDVGEGTYEEINRGVVGRNYGWPTSEGPTAIRGLSDPIYAYAHFRRTPTGCAITGGRFYDPSTPTFPERYVGKYFFADFCGGWIYYLDPALPRTATPFHSGLNQPVGLAVGAGGALLYVQHGNGQLRRIRYTGTRCRRFFLRDPRTGPRGRSGVVTVRLARPPTVARDVTVQRYLSDPSISVSPATVRFTPSNWDTGQRITIDRQAGRRSGGRRRHNPARMAWLAATYVGSPRSITTAPAGSPRAVISQPAERRLGVRSQSRVLRRRPVRRHGRWAQFVVDGVVRYTDVNTAGHYHIGGAHNLWNTTQLRNGVHLLTMRVYDAQGRWSAHSIKVKVRN